MGDAVLGIVANPMSGRDIRRMVSHASVFPTSEKAHMVSRMLSALGALGVDEVLMSTDLGGVSAAVFRETQRRTARATRWPSVTFLDEAPITQTAADTTGAVRRMVSSDARVVVCLGGDGTARVAAAVSGDTPLLPVSTGTNNAFPEIREATTAGLAAGLLATGAVDEGRVTWRAPMLEVTAAGRRENALVDVSVARTANVGSRALWDPAMLTELWCAFAEPDGIGLSSIAGLLCPSPRDDPSGVALTLCPLQQATTVVHAPIAPGLVAPVGIRSWRRFDVGEELTAATKAGVVAVDGEREIELAGEPPVVRLRGDGPRCVSVRAVLTEAARTGALRSHPHPPSQGGTA